jgi:hypothetical protein
VSTDCRSLCQPAHLTGQIRVCIVAKLTSKAMFPSETSPSKFASGRSKRGMPSGKFALPFGKRELLLANGKSHFPREDDDAARAHDDQTREHDDHADLISHFSAGNVAQHI